MSMGKPYALLRFIVFGTDHKLHTLLGIVLLILRFVLQ